MADMVDAGYHRFMAWARESEQGALKFHSRWLGDFNPELSADDANKEHEGRITLRGQDDFKRGWRKAQADFSAEGMAAAHRALKPSY